MSIVTPKVDAWYLIDLLAKNNLVHWHSNNIHLSLFAVAQVAAWFANTRDIEVPTDNPHWRGFILSNPFRMSSKTMEYAKAAIVAPGFRMWNNAANGRHGSLRAVVADPISVQGIIGCNLFFIVLNNHDKRVWEAINTAVVSDTKVLAVNSELFSQWNEFRHIG